MTITEWEEGLISSGVFLYTHTKQTGWSQRLTWNAWRRFQVFPIEMLDHNFTFLCRFHPATAQERNWIKDIHSRWELKFLIQGQSRQNPWSSDEKSSTKELVYLWQQTLDPRSCLLAETQPQQLQLFWNSHHLIPSLSVQIQRNNTGGMSLRLIIEFGVCERTVCHAPPPPAQQSPEEQERWRENRREKEAGRKKETRC